LEYKEWIELYRNEIMNSFESINVHDLDVIAEKILHAKRVFLLGKGRTGLVVKMLASRLTQLDLSTFVIGDPTTPAVEQGDVLILASGSGETEGILSAAKKAKEVKASIIAVTHHSQSSLVRIVENCVCIPLSFTQNASSTPKVLVGTLFEQVLLIFFDNLVSRLLEKSGKDFIWLSGQHANIIG
jgi:6-phospho-3-hexuloisomerase